MPDWLQESGTPISSGSHGETDYIFANGEPVPNTGKSGYVFESGVGIGGGEIIENWESGNFDDWDTTDDGGYFFVQDDISQEGDWSLRIELNYSDNNAYYVKSTNLNTYPSQGDKFSFWYRSGGTAGDKTSFLWNVISESSNYDIWVNQSDGGPNYEKAVLRRNNNHIVDPGNGTWNADPNTWYEIIIDWGEDDVFTLEVRDINGNTVQGPNSGTDTSPLSPHDEIWVEYNVAGTYGTETTVVHYDNFSIIE